MGKAKTHLVMSESTPLRLEDSEAAVRFAVCRGMKHVRYYPIEVNPNTLEPRIGPVVTPEKYVG